MIKVDISNIEGNSADLCIKVAGESDVIYNELVHSFLQLMSNDESAEIFVAALLKSREGIRNDKDK